MPVKQNLTLQHDIEYVEAVKNAPKFGWKDKVGYMMGDLGGNALQTLVNFYLLLFMTSIVGLKSHHFAIIVAVCKALDALNDPIIGNITDRARGTKHGKYKPFIRLVSIPMSIFTVLLFINTHGLPYGARVVYALVVYFLWGVISSFWNIPYGTMMNSITTDLVERGELSNFRSIGSTGANVLVQTIAPFFIYNAMNEATAPGFLMISIILGILSIICLALTFIWCRERMVLSLEVEHKKMDYLKIIKSFGKNRPLIAVILAYIITKFFLQTTATTNQYVFQVYFKDTTTLAAVGMATLIPMLIGMAIMKALLKKFGKRNLVTWPMLAAALCYAYLAFGYVTPILWIAVQMLASFFTGLFSLLVWSLIADGVDYQAHLTKERNDATVYATVTFVVFFISSLSTSMIAILLDVVGFIPEQQANQTIEVANNIRFMAGILPVIGCVLVFICFRFIYNMNDKDMEKISAEVNAMSDEKEHEIEEMEEE